MSDRKFIYLKQSEKLRVHGREVDPDFFEYAKEYGLPIFVKMRWCMRIFKLMPLLNLPTNMLFISGEKQSDSPWRFKYIESIKRAPIQELVLAKDQYHKHFNLKLIFDWDTEHVKKYIKERES